MSLDSELDRTMLEQIRDMDDADQSLLRDIIDTFLEDCPERIAELREGYAAGDLDRVHRAAHTIKGSAGNLGLLGLVEAARVCCDTARRNEHEGLEAQVSAVEAAFPRARELLQAELAGP